MSLDKQVLNQVNNIVMLFKICNIKVQQYLLFKFVRELFSCHAVENQFAVYLQKAVLLPCCGESACNLLSESCSPAMLWRISLLFTYRELFSCHAVGNPHAFYFQRAVLLPCCGESVCCSCGMKELVRNKNRCPLQEWNISQKLNKTFLL